MCYTTTFLDTPKSVDWLKPQLEHDELKSSRMQSPPKSMLTLGTSSYISYQAGVVLLPGGNRR